jgi:hypothetical protein
VRNASPRSPASFSSPGPHANVTPPPYKRGPLSPRALTLALQHPETPSAAAPFPPPRYTLGLTVVEPLRCASDHHNSRARFPSPSRSFPSLAIGSYASASPGIRDEAAAGIPLRPRNSSSPAIPGRRSTVTRSPETLGNTPPHEHRPASAAETRRRPSSAAAPATASLW